MPVMHVVFNEDEWAQLQAWGDRYSKSVGIESRRLTWAQLLLAYANSKVLP